MDWLEAFHNAAQNMNTVNSMKTRALAEDDARARQEWEHFQRLLQAEDPIAMNNYAHWLYHEGGNRELGMEYFAKAAMKGQANSLASFLWFSLKIDEIDDAVTLYEACRNKLLPTDKDQLANIDSNYALCILASGGHSEEALALWATHRAKTMHPECHFFPVVLAHKENDFQLRDSLAANVSNQIWKEMKDLMLEQQMTSKGWFKNWCKDSYKVINELGR